MKKMSRGIAFVAIFWLFTANFVFAAEKIDINTASLEDLMKIVHIGEVRALELISLRPFTSVDDLIRIKGIGETRIKDIKKQGLAWVDSLDVGGGTSNMLEVSPPTLEAPQPEPQVSTKETGLKSPEVFKAVASAPVQKSPVPLLIAGALAAFSGAIILMLKKRLK